MIDKQAIEESGHESLTKLDQKKKSQKNQTKPAYPRRKQQR